ncbi:hypothetical protein O181_086056 [Austropuccinia psidii MF-1]|uniref:Reverse transcriptase Ty1/copia-type domain-containing protein n=1 Tax=Austropuccinia psidii MF-1 TaxID=1389203 RepID=A0A9Q3IKA4_9BASI|nr:hypothetical protein [Austropuccinia psidii MF-1]
MTPRVDEIRMDEDSLNSEMADEIHSKNVETNSQINHPQKIKIIGPWHPTLISSNINQLNVLPFPRRGNALITNTMTIPSTHKNALKYENRILWQQAIDKELKNINQHNMWEVIDQKEDYKFVGTTCIFRIKTNDRNEATEHKVRLCSQGFSQTQGCDFNKTFAPTGRLNSLRTLIAFSSKNNLGFHQIDIKRAFLNAELTETIYLAIPQGLDEDQQQKCLRLRKAIYGLKQAPLAWYTRLKEWLVKTGFSVSILDPCVFFKKKEPPTWIYIHVNDIAIFSKNVTVLKEEIKRGFDIKDFGPADLILGINVTQLNGDIILDQQHYSEALLNLYGISDCKETSTPLVPNEHLGPATGEEIESFKLLKVNFRSAVGSINYLSSATRPDLAQTVSSLLQYLENPGIQHWKSFLHILRYLKGSQELSLLYPRNGKEGIIAYSDADWGNYKATRRSISSYMASFERGLVNWKTRKQQSVLTLTAKAWYKSLCNLTSELLWLKQWTAEVGISNAQSPILIWNDNQSCINTANSDSNFNKKRMKHVDIQLHFVREGVQSKDFLLKYVPSGNMLVDFSTKSVNRNVLERALCALGILRLNVRGDVRELAKKSHD